MPEFAGNILVVGDWVIDENWLVASHDPETSTNSGKKHYRSLVDKPEAQILSLCGAGGIARALHGKFSNNGNVNIYGLGLWHPKDTKLIASLFSSDSILDNETPFTLHGMIPSKASYIKSSELEGKSLCGRPLKDHPCIGENPCPWEKREDRCERLFTIANLLKEKEAKEIGTTRVIRIYSYGECNKLEHLYRFDWTKDFSDKFNSTKVDIFEDWAKKTTFDAVVIADLNKGVITKELVNSIKEKCNKGAKWFVRSKSERPADSDWLKSLNEVNLKLVLIGADVMLKLSSTIKMSVGMVPTDEAINKLKELGLFNLENCKNRLVAGIIDENNAIAIRYVNKETINAYILSNKDKASQIKVGRSSIFFASLISSMLNPDTEIKDKNILPDAEIKDRNILEEALTHTYNWTNNYSKRLRLDNNEQKLMGDHENSLKPEKSKDKKKYEYKRIIT